MSQNYKRKTYYIKNSAQTKFILRFVITSLIGGLIAVSAFNYLSYKKIDSVLYSMRFPKISPGGLLWNEMLYTNIFVIIFTLIVFAVTAKGLINMVHGPLKKMTSDIYKLTAGDLSFKISLREKDEFKDFADQMNLMVSELNNRFTSIRQANDKVMDLAQSAQQSEVKEDLYREIEKSIADLEKTAGSFKI